MVISVADHLQVVITYTPTPDGVNLSILITIDFFYKIINQKSCFTSILFSLAVPHWKVNHRNQFCFLGVTQKTNICKYLKFSVYNTSAMSILYLLCCALVRRRQQVAV